MNSDLRAAIQKIPAREERLGGQTFKYVKLSEVLDLLDTIPPDNTPEPGCVDDGATPVRASTAEVVLPKTAESTASPVHLFAQQMAPDISSLTHQAIFSAVHHHAAEIVRLTAAVPVQCTEPASREAPPPCPSVHDHMWAEDGHCMRCYAVKSRACAWIAGKDFDKDLAHLNYLRAKYDARNEDVTFLLSFIDNVWREYTSALNGPWNTPREPK